METMVTQKWANSYAQERYNMGVVQGKLQALREVHSALQHEHYLPQSNPLYQSHDWDIHFLRNPDYERLFLPFVREDSVPNQNHR